MRIIKNNCEFLFAGTHFHCCKANNENTSMKIEVLGERLAAEIEEFLENHDPIREKPISQWGLSVNLQDFVCGPFDGRVGDSGCVAALESARG